MINFYAKTGRLAVFNIMDGGGDRKRPVKHVFCVTKAFILFSACLLALSPFSARAQDSSSLEPTRIVVDQDKKSFIFIIDNEPVALLDKEGFHVTGSITYGGTLSDAGSVFVKDTITKTNDASAGGVE